MTNRECRKTDLERDRKREREGESKNFLLIAQTASLSQNVLNSYQNTESPNFCSTDWSPTFPISTG